MSEKQETRIERVVVWEGEWSSVRRFFHHVLAFKDCTVKKTTNAIESSTKFVKETKENTIQTTESTIQSTLKWKDSNPQWVIPGFALLAIPFNLQPKAAIRNVALTAAFVSAIFYPKIFVGAFYKPRELFEGMFVSYQQQQDLKKEQLEQSIKKQQEVQQVTTTHTSSDNTKPVDVAIVEEPPKADTLNSQLSEQTIEENKV